MKKLIKEILVLSLLVVPTLLYAQTQTENYVKSTVYKVEKQESQLSTVDNNDKQENITYYDGLGRPKQSISVRAGGQQQDIINHISYDGFGRMDKEYLPYASSSNDGVYRTGDIVSETKNYYLSKYPTDFAGVSLPDVNAYSEKVFENSPLNRVLEQAAPGKDWKKENGHTVKFSYEKNVANEVLHFNIVFPTNNTEAPSIEFTQSYYNDGELYKTITKDENWSSGHGKDRTTEEFKNKQGQVILKRTYNNQSPHDTYYIYDDFGNLTYVLPPLASEQANIYEIGEINIHANAFVEQGQPSGSASFGIRQVSSGTFEFYAEFDLQDLEGSILKTGEIADVSFTHPSLGNSIYVGEIELEGNDGEMYYEFYIHNGKLYCEVEEDGDTSDIVLSDYNDQRNFILPKNVQGLTEAETQENITKLLNDLCYQYKYDNRNRLVEKKIPGKGWEYIVYDKLDRPVMTQDAIQKSNNQWLFTKYDVFGRVIYTGTYSPTSSVSRITIQSNFNTQNNQRNKLFETKVTTGTGYDNSYYTNVNFPSTNLELLTINYYDNYSFTTRIAPITVYSQDVTTRTKGLATGSKIKVLDSSPEVWTITVIYYDEKVKPIYVYSKNDYLETEDIIESKLDFVGKVLETKTTHKKVGKPDIVTIDKLTYDHQDRLLTQKQRINNQAEELIVKNHYDDLGQLVKKEIGNIEAKALQEIDYTYNVRGWLKKINDPFQALGDDLFSMELHYNDYSTRLYNGNISATHWQTASDKERRRYLYYYDDLNRIRSASYYNWGEGGRFNLSTSYDKNGNIQHIYRNGAIVENPEVKTSSHYGVMDNLTYTYDGNQLLKVEDSGNDIYGFKDDTATTDVDDYSYDENGNMIEDLNKNITNIKYNHLNLPTEIEFNDSRVAKKIFYTYDATGSKLSKAIDRGISENEFTYYAGNYIYKRAASRGAQPELEFVSQPEGYASPNNSGNFDYVYQHKDHLGNVRLSYIKNPDQSQEVVFTDGFESLDNWDKSEQPYGYPLLTIDSNIKRSGNYSGRVDHQSGNNDYYIYNDIWTSVSNTEDTDYTFSVWVYLEDVPNNSAQIFLGTRRAGETGHMTGYYHNITYEKGAWVELKGNATVPADVVEITVRIDNNKEGTIWYDDLKVVKGNTSRTVIVEESNYYPFGLKHKGYNNVISSLGNSTAKKFGYNSVELEEGLGLNLMEMEFRLYDPAIARFNGIDPVTHFSQGTSVAFDNNPIYWADPSGADSDIYDHYGQKSTKKTGVDWSQFDLGPGYNDSGNTNGSNNNTPSDCPKCDDPDILLNFAQSVGFSHGAERAEKAIKEKNKRVKSDNFESTETEEIDLLLRGTIVLIKGVDLKYNKKWYQFMSGDNDEYRFDQKFTIETTEGTKEYTAKALMTIYKNVDENNIASMSLTQSAAGYFSGKEHTIRFYNSSGKQVVKLNFKNTNQMKNFFTQYYTRSEKRGYNTIVKNHNKGIKFKH